MLVSLVSCTINTESVLNLHTTKTDRVSRCLLHLCHVRLVMSVVLFSVRIATSKSCTWSRLACSVSNMIRLLWSVHVHTALYRILTGSFCRLTLYGLSLPVRTRNALQNEFDNGTPAVLSSPHLLDVIFGDYCDKQFFLQADGWQTLLPSIGNTWIIT